MQIAVPVIEKNICNVHKSFRLCSLTDVLFFYTIKLVSALGEEGSEYV